MNKKSYCSRCKDKGYLSYRCTIEINKEIIFNKRVIFSAYHEDDLKTGKKYCYWQVDCPACNKGDLMPIPLTEVFDEMKEDLGIDHII